jgi:multidrug efflux pump subunit AcrA (membrane-fusion protein)
MSLKSPIDGRVEKVEVEVGESVNGLGDVVRLVNTDQLWIDVPVPLAKGRTLKLGQTAKVKFPDAEQAPVEGKIIYISTVADAASSTLRTKIEVPNKLKRPAGEHVRVIF